MSNDRLATKVDLEGDGRVRQRDAEHYADLRPPYGEHLADWGHDINLDGFTEEDPKE